MDETRPLSFSFPMALQVSFSFTSHNPCQRNHTPKLFSPKIFSSTSLPIASFSNQKQNPESSNDPQKETLILSLGSSKRRKLNLSVIALLVNGSLPNLFNNSILAQELELERYTDSKEDFTLLTPSSYVKVIPSLSVSTSLIIYKNFSEVIVLKECGYFCVN